MTAQYIIPKGDYGYNLDFVVKDYDGNIYDLTDYTITLKVWALHVEGTLLINAACDIDDAAAGECHYVIQQNDFGTAGKFEAELELTKTGVVESTQKLIIYVEGSG